MKRIIISCDGTWQSSDGGALEVPTNVTRINRAIKATSSDGIHQITYYQAGVGTGGTLNKLVGGGTGMGLSENVREAYGFLAHNYLPGDSIHLYGFSRGAYTARSICGLICRVGILTKRGMEEFYYVYKAYVDGKLTPEFAKDLQTKENGALVFPDVKITTIGVWDTVGSLGVPSMPIPGLSHLITGLNFKRYSFHDTELHPNVLHAFQALGLDEHRRPFQPALWKKTPDNTTTDLRQCWFPGVHTNIGGGYEDQEIADMTLAWMIQSCAEWIEFDEDYLRRIINNRGNYNIQWAAGKIYNSHTGLMLLGGKVTRTPGEYADPVVTCERVHISVRIRKENIQSWDAPALKGWVYDVATTSWRKGDKELKEEQLGEVEMELAGREVVSSLMAKTPSPA